MIKVICGKKGSGKTKRLIDLANESIKEQRGDVLFLDDDNRYMFDLRHEIRFINAGEYGIKTPEMLYGFLTGLLAQNFDTSLIFVDAFKKLCGSDLPPLQWLFDKLEALTARRELQVVFSISCDPDDLPEFIKKYVLPAAVSAAAEC
ncbi:MAG: hypothetical protein LBD16_00625 [Oscillospiraceae bacterium]|nr:hypothetical protein [Oscillospiraceae bacterium]